MKKLSLRFPISIQISFFLIIAVFVPVAAMMMLSTYESQLLTMTENSNVQQGRILSSSLSVLAQENHNISSEKALEILSSMEGQFDSRIRILDSQGHLLADSSRIDMTPEKQTSENSGLSLRLADSEAQSSSEKASEDSFVYRLFSIPVRAYRKLRPPAVVYSNADYYSSKTVYDGEEIKAALSGHYGAKTRISSGGQVSVTLYSALPVIADNEVIGVVLVSRSTWRILQNLYELRTDLAKIFLVSLAFVLLIALFLGFRISRPLKKLARQTSECADKKGHIDSEKLKHFTGSRRKDEIGDLSRSFKTLLDKLDARIRYTQAFASDVNHEFKNPLAAIRSSAELLGDSLSEEERRNFSQAITDEITRLEKLLTEVRNISKIDGTDAEAFTETIPLNTFINNLVSRIKSIYPEVKIDTVFAGAITGEAASINFNPDYLERILSNLIENAAGFASQIQVTTSINEIPKKHKKELQFSIADNGCGIDESEYDKIFERFYSNRPASSKAESSELGHTGLGLSIVKAITDACEGTIKISRSTSLGGAEFTVGLPL